MHRGGISPGRGNREKRGRGRGGDRRGGRGGHPSGLRGKDLGLWYARRGKARKEKQDIEQRSVISIQKDHEENITSLLQSRKADQAAPSESNISSQHTASQDDMDQDFILLKEDKEILDDYVDKIKFEYNETQTCALKKDDSFDKNLLEKMKTRQENSQFQQMQKFRQKLPSYSMKDQVLETISSNQVVVISGETGCGKTTQVAQFILDDYIQREAASTCHVICTQPRRISAISVAERVAAERGERCGQSCGYQIRLECKMPSERGSILYCTTGILLRRLIGDPYLSSISHIIIDEIHERDLMSDFLLIIVKDLLSHRPDLKVVLMSATLNAEMFSFFFNNCPMLHIPGFTYPVKEFLLEDIIEMTSYRVNPAFKKREPPKFVRHLKSEKAAYHQKMEEEENFYDFLTAIEHRYSRNTLHALEMYNFESIDNQLIVQLVNYICLQLGDGAILIFLPGWDQISSLHDLLIKNPVYNSRNFIIIPLHSLMPTANQREVFEKPPIGVRKIIIATNIAETRKKGTSQDVDVKNQTYDVETNVSCLKPVWISKASAKQRRGRAGRVQSGYCFHLYTAYHFNNFQDYQLPEMLRTPLDTLCLQIKILRLGKMWEFLTKALEPPQQKAVENAIRSLTQMRALDDDEELTPLGYHLAKLPVAPKVGRMILFGAMFACLDPVLTIAASLDFKDPFYIPIHKEKEADVRRSELSRNSRSDHIMLVNAVKGWEEAKRHSDEGRYCWKNFLSINTLKEKGTSQDVDVKNQMIANMKGQFAQHLHQIGFLTNSNVKDYDHNKNSDNINLIKAVLCAGLYPNVAKISVAPKNKRPPKLYTEEFGRVVIHPKSVNSEVTEYQTQWLIYHEKMKTTKLYLYDTTEISPLPLLFFGGTIKVHQEDGMDTIQVDKGIKFHAPIKIAHLVKDLRHELDVLLNKKIKNPSLDLTAGHMSSSQDDKILQAIIALITDEKIKTKADSGYK